MPVDAVVDDVELTAQEPLVQGRPPEASIIWSYGLYQETPMSFSMADQKRPTSSLK